MTSSRLLRSFWPQSDDEDFLVVARKRAIILFGVTGGLITLLSGIRHVAMNGGNVSVKDFILVIVCPLLFFVTPWVVTRAKNTNLVFGIFILYGYCLVLANHFNGGGLVSHASFFLVALSCLVAVNYGWRGAGIAIALTITHFIVLITFREHFTLVVDFAAPGAIDIWLASGLIFILLLTSIGGAACQSETRRAAEKLAEARAAAEMASTAKSEFLANMSHEIRTPMNGVLGMAELLKETDLTEQQKVFAETIYGSGSALLAIINDILDYSKIEAGKVELDPSPFCLKSAIQDVVALLSVTARAKNIELILRAQSDLPECVVGDVSRIRQAVTNLVGNAIKFTHEGHVSISVIASVDREIANVRIIVEDTGIGIAPDKIDDIFGQFTQAESSTTRKYGGTGLGLSITRNLIEAMGGSVEVKSTLGKGATFIITLALPIAEQPRASCEARHSTPPKIDEQVAAPDQDASLRPKILIAEDNEVNRLVIRHMIDPNAFEIAFAENGKAAYSMACQSAYDIILMDISMPEMDGIEATKAIRAHERSNDLSETVIIAMTAHAMAGDRERFLDAGMNNYIQKPVNKKSIDDMLRKCLDDVKETQLKAG